MPRPRPRNDPLFPGENELATLEPVGVLTETPNAEPDWEDCWTRFAWGRTSVTNRCYRLSHSSKISISRSNARGSGEKDATETTESKSCERPTRTMSVFFSRNRMARRSK
ncbi:hypothetical protein E1A91_A12G238000v1 [Gossypium mustelinum]|uniref:Uncharacterized protein n=1 Tax=Gossypium mustelinum TaxID=34275 RepID=A0A5D2WXP5_GOSMU|nr:hypothetical protein E1A91_A12G238000v1 [Gossypium mustelinum]TYJ06498.1 hypothetical protein E1A91_A12G238000v1 [Gossypium mustelinum]TYJ06499.1 hypothetical protein E1A91_A12G238000v1 [Gossypium mustelinum]